MERLSGSCIALVKVVIVAGPTASGKSALALKLAHERGGVILNADSLQVYKGIEILTAQPQDFQGISHRLYGFLDLSKICSVGLWLDLIHTEIQKAFGEGRVPIVAGGTGLYLKALLEGLPQLPSSFPDIRKELQSISQDELYKELQKNDPHLASQINPHDHQRTLRGLEVYLGTGKPLSEWQGKAPKAPLYDFEKILLMPSKEELEERIVLRIDQMLEDGVIEEVRKALGVNPSVTAMKAIGLREFGAYLSGECSLDEAKELTIIHTRQYAKRQRTWFRHQWN